MAKKRRSSRGLAAEGDDTTSIASTATLASLQDVASASGDELEFVDPFERCLEALYEKRSSTRVTALTNLVSLLERSYCYEDCLSRKDSIVSQMISCIRKGASAEAGLAARALGLHLLTLGIGPELDGLYDEAIVALQKVVLANGKDAKLRALALDLVALLTFIAQEDPQKIMNCINGMLTVAESSGDPKVAASALSGWTLLVSSHPSWRLDAAFCSSALTVLSRHLHANDVAQRDAAGEGTALLFAMTGLNNLGAESDDDSAGEEPNGVGEIVDRMRQLATNRGDETRRSKRDRSFLKSTFREHYKIIEGQRASFDRVKMRDGRTLVIDTLEGQVELNALREFLGSAFQVQLEANTVLHDIFGLNVDENSEILQLNESGYKVQRGPSTAKQKMRSKNRSKDQLNKAYYTGSILDTEE